MFATEGDIPLPKVTIRIPARKGGSVIELETDVEDAKTDEPKRKHLADTDSEDEKPIHKKHKHSKNRKPYISDNNVLPVEKRGRPRKEVDNSDSDDALPTIVRKRGRGRPRKDKENQPPKGFDVSVVIEVAQPLLHVKGKTYKGNKWVKQEPIKLGPFRFNESMSWLEFLEQVGKTAFITEHQMVLSGMTWRTNKSANSALPLTGPGGYQTMVQQLLSMKDPSSAVLIIGHPVPKDDSPEQEVPVSFRIYPCYSDSMLISHLKPWARKGGVAKQTQADEDEYAEDSMIGRKVKAIVHAEIIRANVDNLP